jgi:hypothetical protein
MDAILTDPSIEHAVITSQDQAVERLRQKDFAGMFLRYVDRVLQRSSRQAPEVAFDFWAQFDQFERLEELRQYRPANYRALPADPRLAAPGSPFEGPEPGRQDDSDPRSAELEAAAREPTAREPRP